MRLRGYGILVVAVWFGAGIGAANVLGQGGGFDFDCDNDVDLLDFGQFQLCFGGPDTPFADGCDQADGDGDGDVDLLDFGGFQLAFTGATGIPAELEWSTLGAGVDNTVFALVVFDDGSGPALFAGGSFTGAGGLPAGNIAKWDGENWSTLGSGVNGIVFDLVVFDDGNGESLFVGGNFTTAGGGFANRVARWDGSNWFPVGTGMETCTSSFCNTHVNALGVFDDGGGEDLYAAGEFVTAGGVTCNSIARWNGANWSALGAGLGGAFPRATSLEVFNEGSGDRLFVGGSFAAAGGAAIRAVARWDGVSWTGLAAGLSSVGTVSALQTFDDGSGLALFAGGSFSTGGGAVTNNIAKWNGISWSGLAGGANGIVNSLEVFDDGDGAALFVGGQFFTAGPIDASRIARWNGVNWSPLGTGVNSGVLGMTVFDDGSGAALFAGGLFNTAGGLPANNVARWGRLLSCN
jgi:hypothetical protein